MYVETWKEMVMDDPYPMYQSMSELIEADGEAEELFLQETVDNQYPSRYFTAIDWVSEYDIQLDITNYISKSTFELYENVFMNVDENEEVSLDKANSFLQACIQNTKRLNRRRRNANRNRL